MIILEDGAGRKRFERTHPRYVEFTEQGNGLALGGHSRERFTVNYSGVPMRSFFALLAALSALAAGQAAASTTYRLDAMVTSLPGNGFSYPIFTFTNLSSAGVQVDGLSVSNGPPWDWINSGVAGPDGILNPASGTRTLLIGEEASTDQNNGVTASISYSFTGFDSAEFFRFAADPEAPNGGSAVVDVRPFLLQDLLTMTASFAGGPILTGSDWTLELIDPQGSADSDFNQRYHLTLQQTVGGSAVPEPSTWAVMLAGFGMAGMSLRRGRTYRLVEQAPNGQMISEEFPAPDDDSALERAISVADHGIVELWRGAELVRRFEASPQANA